MPAEAADLDALWDAMMQAPAEFGMMPFWFWNDDLEETELLRQLRAFAEAGLGGVVIHARTGLGRDVGYLTPHYFRLVRRVVDECAALRLKVILYDEGGYPSGSACGGVVAANPEFAARALVLVQREVQGPCRMWWRPNVGRSLQQRLVSAAVAPARGDGGIDPSGLRALQPDARGLVLLDLGPGAWRALACVDVPSGGTIRGVLPEHEDGAATAPPAGDLMRPDAVAEFIRLTHEGYASALGAHMGTTVVAMFTDEPNPLGRGHRRAAHPYTPDFQRWLGERLARDDIPQWLPALWLDYGPGTAEFRRAYAYGVRARVREVFYGAQAAWCARHGIALTGHPADSDDMASLADFQWPGQDMVWRWVVPGDGSGLEGAHSTAPKAAASAAAVHGRARSVAELFGAYGWRLSLDEAKWLMDWHLARGVNLLLPHACFYSVRDGRAYESEPDIGLHNVWWPHFAALARYARRVCRVLAEGRRVCPVGVVAPGAALPWAAERALYEAQVDFLYVDEAALASARWEGGRLVAGAAELAALVVDWPEEAALPAPVARTLAAARAAGVAVLPAAPVQDLAARVRQVLPQGLDTGVGHPDVRALHARWRGAEALLFFNEGEAEVDRRVTVAGGGRAEWWDPLRGERRAAALGPDGRLRLRLPRRECRILVVVPGSEAPPAEVDQGWDEEIPLAGPWSVSDGRAPALGDWAGTADLERLSGTLTYETEVEFPRQAASVELDLGAVGEAADVRVNGRDAGRAMWSPYRVTAPGRVWRIGANHIVVAVTNSAANWFDGAARPSGLMGPVRLRVRWTGPGERSLT